MSLTAVTSFVSVIREKTVFVLKLNVTGTQRVAVPITVIVSSLVAIGLFIAAAASDEMLKLKLTLNGTSEDRGNLHFSLFRGAHSVTPRISGAAEEPDTNQYLIHNVYRREDLIGVYATIVALCLTVVLCLATAGLAFFNTFGTYTSWLYGPPMLYVLSLATAFMGSLTIAVISDYYLWELDTSSYHILRASLPSNLEYLADVYAAHTSLGYSFWLLIVGCVFPVISFLLSWRLVELLDSQEDPIPHTQSHFSGLEMTTNSGDMYY